MVLYTRLQLITRPSWYTYPAPSQRALWCMQACKRRAGAARGRCAVQAAAADHKDIHSTPTLCPFKARCHAHAGM